MISIYFVQSNVYSPVSRAIDKLPATLAMMGEAIESQTGWNITFLVGGPEPINDGKIMTYMYANNHTLFIPRR